MVAALCCGAVVLAYVQGYANGKADALDETGKVFCEALGKVVEMTNGLLKELEELQP